MTDMPPYLDKKDEDSNSENSDSEDSSSDVDDWDLPLCFDKARHLEPIKGAERLEHTWRVKEKYKTHCVALVLCLNVGVDPPDVVKTQPCARLECWIDPNSLSPSKALESIGHALQLQYERWQPRARYKQSLDPTSDEIKKLCCSLRRNAKDERVLFHYNGHGVPKPTVQGEIWVFNRAYTQYIPLSMYDLQSWMGAPSLYVYDCSNAGVIIDNFRQFAEQHEREHEASGGSGPGVSYKNCIQLAACARGQSLPMSPELPADVFTACLTTPVKVAMRWFVLRAPPHHRPHLLDLIDKIPGQVTDRRTMLGELNWIFTAITDTIAWSSLPADLFQQLFRADLLTASLCRNFLLADRIMRSYNCTPVMAPALPSLARHPLWAAWDHALDLALAQLPSLLLQQRAYAHSPFFRDQLSAFRVWLELGAGSPGALAARAPPAQLPMVLQVLLSTLHRVRALQLLGRFLRLGRWAARAALLVGVFPYMLKLLQAPAADLRPPMVLIWAHLAAADPSCQVDLVNAKGHKYFLSVLQDSTVDCEHRTMAAYVLAAIVDNYPPGQEAALQSSMISICLEQTAERLPALRQWACLALGRLWRGYDAARWAAARDLAHEKLFPLLEERCPEVRAACVFALGTLVGGGGGGARGDGPQHAAALLQHVGAALAARAAKDAAALVRAEILAALQWVVLAHEQHFIAVYIQERVRRSDKERVGRSREADVPDRGVDALALGGSQLSRATKLLPSIGFGSVYMRLWQALAALAREPLPQTADMAAAIIRHVADQVDSVAREVELGGGGGAASLPASPGRPPSATATADPRGGRRPKGGSGSGAGLPNTISEDSVPSKDSPRDRDSTSSNSSIGASAGAGPVPRRALVSTRYVEWAAARFCGAAAGGGGGGGGDTPDPHARDHHARAWRYKRNRELRAHARALRAGGGVRVEAQAFSARCPLPPGVVALHPYEQQLAVAARDGLAVWHWGSAARLCSAPWRAPWGRPSALAYLNAHDRALLAAASHKGDVAVYRPSGGSSEPTLVAAWRGLEARPPALYRPPPAQPLISLAQLVSEQFAAADERLAARKATPLHPMMGGGAEAEAAAGAGAEAGAGGAVPLSAPRGTLLAYVGARHSLALAGHAAAVRLWDTHAELLAAELATQSEAAVTSVWRRGWTLTAGFADGAVRAWDERAPAAPSLRAAPHAAPVLCAARRGPLLHTVCANGWMSAWDVRRAARPLRTARGPAPLAAAAVHPHAPLLACGSVNQCISVYDLSGAHLNTIKFHEGFMGARIGPVACLAFHPLRVALGVGSKDSSVCVYVGEGRR